MKILVLTLILLSPPSFATPPVNCASEKNATGGNVSISLTDINDHEATLAGVAQGGMAHFVRKIGPLDMVVEHVANGADYQNKEQDIDVTLITSGIGGRLVTSAEYREGKSLAIPMSCK